MPVINIKKKRLDELLNNVFTEKEFEDLCFEYGLELDEVTSERALIIKERGTLIGVNLEEAADEIIYKIEVPANRYDLLCAEGLCRALLIFRGELTSPIYRTEFGNRGSLGNVQKLIIKPETLQIRPHAVAAVLRNIKLTQEIYNSFIDLQDKLHQNLGRKRTLVAIGTHDLDTVKGPFIYTAKHPKDIVFCPLNQSKIYTAEEMMQLYSNDSHLRHYLHILKDKPVYPVIYDSAGTVLSMPPIINGNHSKLTLSTKNILIECTATDLTKAKIVLDTIVTMFSQYCDNCYKIEPVEIITASKQTIIYPELYSHKETITVDEINTKIGVNLNGEQIASLLNRMSLDAVVDENDGNRLLVDIPPTRQDVIHRADIIEDVAIAFGYNNITKQVPQTYCVGSQFSLNKLTDKLRIEMMAAGFTEALTFSLCSLEDISTKLCRPNGVANAVHIANPKSLDFQVARTSLLPGILKTISYNKNMPLPLKLFEIQDVVVKDATKDVGARNERHLCVVYYAKTPGFEIVHGVLDRVMQLLQVGLQISKSDNVRNGYHLEACEDPTYFEGRTAAIFGPEKCDIGRVGVLNPDVISAFDLALPCASLEINIEPFF